MNEDILDDTYADVVRRDIQQSQVEDFYENRDRYEE